MRQATPPDPALADLPALPAARTTPYQGLQPYAERDARSSSAATPNAPSWPPT